MDEDIRQTDRPFFSPSGFDACMNGKKEEVARGGTMRCGNDDDGGLYL